MVLLDSALLPLAYKKVDECLCVPVEGRPDDCEVPWTSLARKNFESGSAGESDRVSDGLPDDDVKEARGSHPSRSGFGVPFGVVWLLSTARLERLPDRGVTLLVR